MGIKRKAPSFDPSKAWARLKEEGFSAPARQQLIAENVLHHELWPSVNEKTQKETALLVAVLCQDVAQATNDVEGAIQYTGICFIIGHAAEALLDSSLSMKGRTILGRFLLSAFTSLHLQEVQQAVQPLVSIAIWSNLLEGYREALFEQTPGLRKRYNKAIKAADESASTWLARLLADVTHALQLQRSDAETVDFCQVVLQLFTLLLSQLPTRRYTAFLLLDAHAEAMLAGATRMQQPENGLLRAQFELFSQTLRLPVDNIAGVALTEAEARAHHSALVSKMQRVAFSHHKDALLLTALANHSAAVEYSELTEQLQALKVADLQAFCERCNVRTSLRGKPIEAALLIKAFVQRFAAPLAMHTLFDTSVMPTELSLGVQRAQWPFTIQSLSVPALLLCHYRRRHQHYHQQLASELSETLARLQPVFEAGKLSFRGSSKNARSIERAVAILEVLPPIIGQVQPALVRAEVKLNVSDAWSDLEAGELITCLALVGDTTHGYAVKSLRTGFVEEILSADGKPLREAASKSQTRVVRVLMDAAAYEADRQAGRTEAVYGALQLVLRRPKSTRLNKEHILLNQLKTMATSAEAQMPDAFVDLVLGLSADGPAVDAPPKASHPPVLPFTLSEAQSEAIDQALQTSVALVDGVAGSGKTSMLACIAQRLYQSPDSKTLCIVADAAAAERTTKFLRQFGIAARHICDTTQTALLGHEAMHLAAVEQSRQSSLQQVTKLAQILEMPGDHGASCESAAYFHASGVLPAQKSETGTDKLNAFESTKGSISEIFQLLEQVRPLECLRSHSAKEAFLLSSLARVTILPADDLVECVASLQKYGCKFDAVLVDDAQSVDEHVTLLALRLATAKSLKRLVLIGHDNYAGPSSQSLFSRLTRTGVSRSTLTKQYVMRADIAAAVMSGVESGFSSGEPASAGLAQVCALINVPSYQGQNETEPRPGHFQNLGEAEYMVALYQYMRLLDYPRDKITLLCLEAGQKALVLEVLETRCRGKLFGMPQVATVLEMQAHRNDFILLSCTRTQPAGSLLNKRLLETAFSRARLGLYVFCRSATVQQKGILQNAWAALGAHGKGFLQLVSGEMYGTCKRKSDESGKAVAMTGVEHLGQYVYEMTNKKIEAVGGR